VTVAIEPCFRDEARRQLEAEARAAFERRVDERALALQGQSQRIVAGNDLGISSAPGAQRWKLDELVARRTQLRGNVPPRRGRLETGPIVPVPVVARSAAEDQELQLLDQQIYQLVQQCHQNGTLPRNVKAEDLPLKAEPVAA